MADTIEKVIYKLELDSSGYINGVNSLSDSTKKLTVEQELANKALADAKKNLDSQSTYLQQAKKDLETYTGTNEKYRQQLAKSFQSAQADNQKLNDVVNQNRVAYEAATKAAQQFAEVSARANNLQPVQGQGKVTTPAAVTVGPQITSQIAGVLNVAEFAQQAQILEKTKNEFDDLRVSIGLAEARMKQLNATDDEFKLLAPIVEQGKEALKQYDIVVGNTVESQAKLRTEIFNNTDQLAKLALAGDTTSEKYVTLQKETAHLTELYHEQRKAITVLSSETKVLDFGKAAVTAAISGFQAYSAVSILAGGASEELQKKTEQLFAAMQLLTALDQLAISVKKGSTIATGIQSIAQATYTAVVGASTGALKAFKLALVGSGIGAAIVLIGYLVSKWIQLRDAQQQSAEKQKLINEVVAEGNKNAGKQIADLKILTTAVKDTNLTLTERLNAVKQLQKEFPDYFGNLSKEAILTGDITKATNDATLSIQALSRATAAKGKLDEIETQRLDFAFTRQKIINATNKELANAKDRFLGTAGGGETKVTAESDKIIIRNRRESALADIKDKDDKLQRQEDFLIKFAGLDKIAKTIETPDKEKTKTDKKVREIQNDFEKKKAELDARLAALNAKEAEDESKIRIEFAAKLVKEQLEITKNKNLTKGQKGILNQELVVINKAELDKAIEDFRKKIIDARQKLNDDLTNLQNKNTQDQLNLIQDEFTRRAALIDFNEKKDIAEAAKVNKKRLSELDLLYTEEQKKEKGYQNAKAALISAGELQGLNIIAEANNKRKNLSADLFQELLNSYTSAIANADLVFSEDEAKAIRSLADKFLAGKISYEKFQNELTKIEKKGAKDRLESALVVEIDELAALDRELAAIEDKYSEHYKKLKKQRDDLAGKVATDTKAVAKDDVVDPNTKKKETVSEYADAVGQVADSVVQFWQAANDAESKALDRSISLQEKRVDAAQRIADRGNAQYLKAEQDRLTELNVQRENAARKQLGIDAALQASQILVGITGAISHIASGKLGAAQTIAEIAVIIGALATGYGIVKSLQGNQPKLFKGTKHLERNGQPSGRDTIPIMANEGEAIIPTARNKAYSPTVAAIYDGTIPAEHLNNFVRTYHRIKAVPQPNYERIKEAGELKINSDGKMAVILSEHSKKLDESNELQRLTLRAMKSMAVSATVDKNGVAIMVNEHLQQMKLDKYK